MGCASSSVDTPAPVRSKLAEETGKDAPSVPSKASVLQNAPAPRLIDRPVSIGPSMELTPSRWRYYQDMCGKPVAPDFSQTEAYIKRLEQFLDEVSEDPAGFVDDIFDLRAKDAVHQPLQPKIR
eukprot:4510312-Amphidinium_carterae.1